MINTESSESVAVIGQGYVGLPVAMTAVAAGFHVVGIDLDETRVKRLENAHSYINDVADEILKSAIGTGKYLPTTRYADAQGFNYAIITVPTPLKDSLPDLSFIEDAARSLGAQLRKGATVVLESTTYPGTTEELLVPILEQESGLKAGIDFYVGYSPERIDPGNKKYGFVETPKVVSGINEASLEKVDELYSQLVNTTVRVSGTREAELTKLLENTFRHVNIALMNELAMFASQLDINIWEAIDAASTKPFGYMRFTPGPGVGGHCLPVDPSYLSWQVRRQLGQNFRFVELANDVNDHMPNYVVQRVMKQLNNVGKAVKGSTILIVGLAYKRDTSDIRESPALKIIELLQNLGATIQAVDPHVEPYRWPANTATVDLTQETIKGADLAIVVTPHQSLNLNLLTQSDTLVFDTQNVLKGENVERL